MKRLMAIITVLLLSISLHAEAFKKSVDSMGSRVLISSEKPLGTGMNTLLITLDENKFDGAKVVVKVFMPEMPGMPRMEEEVQAKALGDGRYACDISFAMEGTWQVWISVEPKEGKKVRFKTSLNI